jgi:trehalose synthase
VLAGPSTAAVANDPEGAEVLSQVARRRAGCPPEIRDRIHLLSLPMDDVEENAAIVNALQRRADVVVQKSLAEGFGLTVAEAMWKGRPVVASRVGGIREQIVEGDTGLLVEPRDLPGSPARCSACVSIRSGPGRSERERARRSASSTSSRATCASTSTCSSSCSMPRTGLRSSPLRGASMLRMPRGGRPRTVSA